MNLFETLKTYSPRPFAEIFLRMVKMIIAPLLFSTLVVGIAGHGDAKSLGKIGLKTIIYFEIVTTLALIIGLTMGNIFKPGVGFVSGTSVHAIEMQAAGLVAASHAHTSIGAMVTDIFPTSVVDAMAKGNLLQIVVFSIFFALAICAVGKKAQPVLDLLNSVSQIMFKFTEYVMYFAPLGIFGVVCNVIATTGLEALLGYLQLLLVLIGSMLFVALIFNPFLVWLYIRRNPYPLTLATLRESGVTAFFTRSSAANIPVNMGMCRRLDLDEGTYSITIPLGATINMAGAAITITVLTLAAANSLSIEAVGFIIGVLQDSAETALNSSSDVLFTAAACLRAERLEMERVRKEELINKHLNQGD